jgi:hypothetical protein
MLGIVAAVEDGGPHDVAIAIRQVAQVRAACQETQARWVVVLNRLLEPFVGKPAPALRNQNSDVIRWLGTPEPWIAALGDHGVGLGERVFVREVRQVAAIADPADTFLREDADVRGTTYQGWLGRMKKWVEEEGSRRIEKRVGSLTLLRNVMLRMFWSWIPSCEPVF